MSRFLRFFGVIIVAVACAFGVAAPRAGYADDPVTYPFTVDVHISDGNSPFVFTINAAGTFYVNWGDGSAEQQVVAGVVNSRVSQHTYDTAGYYTVGLRGTATGYSDDSEVPAISFGDSGNNTDDAVVGISGSLGAIFPTIDNKKIPSFYGTFDGCQNLTGAIPADLFSGVTGTRSKMFSQTFSGTRITSIPAGLFNGIVGDAQEAMFYGTFYNCTGLQEIPDGLFSGVVGRAKNAFAYTFGECANIGGYIPKHLFNLGGLVYSAGDTMMYYTFENTDLADTCSDFRLTHYPTDFDTDWDGPVVCAPMATFTCDMPNVGGTGTAPTSIWLDEITNQTEMPDTAVCTAPTHYSDNHKWACTGVINCDGGSWAVGTAVPSWLRTQTANVDFYNNYAPDVYSVTLNANNGNGGVAALYEQYNVGWAETNASGTVFGELTVSSLPTRSNYTFIGYYTAQSGGTRVIDAAGHVLALPNTLAAGGTTWYAHWESSSGPFTVTFKCDEDGTVVNTQTVGYQGVLNVPDASSSVCSKEGYSFSNWKIVANGELIPISSNNGTFTWSKYFSSDVVPNWGNTQTTITLNPHNTANASGTSGQRYIYTTAGVGAYLDSARTKLMKTNDNKIELPTKSVRLIFDLNDTVMVPATLTSGTCNSDTGTTLSGTVFEESLAFDGYFSAPNGGTQYIGDGGFLTSGAESVVESYVNNMTWHAQWKPTNPIENCKISEFSPTRPGYIFNGWWTQAVGGIRKDKNCSGDNLPGCFDFINHPWVIDSDTVLYAQWKPVCNAVTLDSNNNAATAGTILTLYKKTGTPGTWYTDSNCTIVFTSGDYADIIPMRSGWVFRGFYPNLTDAFDVSATQSSGAARYITNTGVPTETGNTWNPTGNATLYAGWARDCVSAAAASCSLNVSGDAVGYTTSCNTGYTLDSGGGTYNPICTANTYNITYNYDGGSNTSALPSGYTQLEYIESTGTQYIDTGYKPNQDTSVEITYMYTGTTSSNQIVLGTTEAGASNNARNGLVFLLFPNRVGFGNGTGTTVNLSGVGNTAGTKYTLRYDKNVVSLDGSTIATLPVTTWSAPYNLYLFGRNTANSLSLAMRGRIYSYKAWDNGTLVQHLVPAKNSSNVVGMYDLVSGTFFENAGTGNFTAGNTVTTAYPATYTYGTDTTIYGVPSRANSIFESWCRGYDSTNNTYSDCVFPHEITATDLGNKTLYAKWTCAEHYHLNGAGANESCEADVYTVTMDMNHSDASGYTNPTATIYEKYNTGWATTNTAGTTFGSLNLTGNQLPTRAGYTFAGYADAASGGNAVGTFAGGTWTAPAASTYTADATLYAQWTANTYTITYVDNGGTRSSLPTGYTMLEYLQSDGSQIIETGVMGVNTRLVIDAQWTGSSVSSIRMLVGYSDNYSGTFVGVSGNKWALAQSDLYRISGATNRTQLSVVFDRNPDADNRNRATLTANGETVTYTRSSTASAQSRPNGALKLFAGRASVNSTPDGFTGRVYRAMIFDNDTNHLLFNGFPARRDSDDALGIYDTVRGRFIENSGDGTFTAGGDVTTPYPTSYTAGVGATVYGVPTRANSVFDGWCTDSNLTTGCASPYEITTTDSGNKTLYAKWTCDGGYVWNSTTSACEMDPVFTITTTTDIANGTEFKFKISARGWFGVDCGADGILSGPSGHVSGNIITRTSVVASDTQASAYTYMCTYSSAGPKTIKFIGRAASYGSVANAAAISFFNATVDEDNAIVVDENDVPQYGTEVYIASISGSLGAMFPTKPRESNSQPRFYQTFRNARNMAQTMQSISGIFDGVYGAPVSYMFTGTFRGCLSLTGSIPENLFAGISGAPATYMFGFTFSGCSGLSGAIPANLFGRVVDGEYVGISGAPANYMFYSTFNSCTGLTSIPGDLFGRVVNGVYYGINGAPAAQMFHNTFLGCTGLTGSIPATLFGRTVNGTYYGINGQPSTSIFRGTFRNCSGLTGEIPSDLFGHISGDAAQYMFYQTFYGCSGLTGTIPGNLFGGQYLTGPGKAYMFRETFSGCTNLSGYVPENLFGQMTVPETVPSYMMYRVFADSGLATSCPCGTTEITTSPFRSYWSSKVSCAVGLDTGQHWYNGQCTTMCSDASIDELHVGGLSAFPVLADKITTPSINVKLGNTQCYVPLATGNGGTNSFNISYDGNVYHADRPDDITPVGFGQRD